MFCLDHTCATPEENIDYDETLLIDANTDQTKETLRFWESPDYFVVLGKSNQAEIETHFSTCQKNQIPILKRCSGGGTVLQGPGCLNYALVLLLKNRPELANITSTTQYILTQNKIALSQHVSGIEIQGISDLTVNQIKFSGNAQRRMKHAVLFHGTFLYQFNLALIERYLAYPSKSPTYRKNRSHSDFLSQLPLTEEEIKDALTEHWVHNCNIL